VLDIGGPARTVTPITVATNTARSPITVGPAPAALAITPDGKTLYVADVEGTVTPISVATDTAGPQITVAQEPDQIVITPDSKRAYVLSYDGTVTPIVTATNTAGQAILIADAIAGGMVLTPGTGPGLAARGEP
jgi:DNA-binding beta-propeller fold protein YncE